MDWFEQLTGFRETTYEATRAKLKVEGARLTSLVNGKSHGIGEFELVSLQTLRERAMAAGGGGRLKAGVVIGDVRQLHRAPEYAGALFQVASQFNALEMTGPDVTPEHGVTRYKDDPTQGPACAIAAGAATIYRNYFAPAGGGFGQTADRQLDGLDAIGRAFAQALGKPISALWEMRNGYAMCRRDGMNAISAHLAALGSDDLDVLRGKLAIGWHRDIDVTDAPDEPPPVVSQAFCSALPVAYMGLPAAECRPFASLVLEAAYEATMWTAAFQAARGGSNVVLLTLLGGGVFGNGEAWILAAMRRAFERFSGYDLQVKIVCYGAPSPGVRGLARSFG